VYNPLVFGENRLETETEDAISREQSTKLNSTRGTKSS